MLNFILASVISGVWFVGPNIDADIALCIAPKTIKCEFQRAESQRAEPKREPKVTSRVLTEQEFNQIYGQPIRYYRSSGYSGSCSSCNR